MESKSPIEIAFSNFSSSGDALKEIKEIISSLKS